MEYQLLWSGHLWIVPIPVELISQTEKIKWTYVQAFAVTGGSHSAAMRLVFQQQYPGLGFGSATKKPVSVSSVGGFVSPSLASDVCVSEPGKSSPAVSLNNRSQRPKPPRPGPSLKYAGSGTSGPRKPAPQFATSTPGLPSGKATQGARGPHSGQPKPTQPAKIDKGGWLGSAPTKPAAV
jgi:hypothetical protein